MITGLELATVAVVLLLVVGVASIITALRPLLLNAAGGLLTLVLAQVLFGLEVAMTALTLVVVAVGGVPGAAAVLALSVLGVAFVS